MAANPKNEITAESTLNKDDNTLPYGYFHPETEGKLTWVCGNDANGKITSVFCMDNGPNNKDKKCQYLEDLEKAKFIRDELIKDGWQKIKGPKVTFTLPDGSESSNLNRKQKRFLQRKMNNMNKQNPFGPPGNQSVPPEN